MQHKRCLLCSLSANRSKRPFIFIFMAFSPNYQIFKCRLVKLSRPLMWAGWRPLNAVVWENSLEIRLWWHDFGEQRLSRHQPKLNVETLLLDLYCHCHCRLLLCHDQKCHNQEKLDHEGKEFILIKLTLKSRFLKSKSYPLTDRCVKM